MKFSKVFLAAVLVMACQIAWSRTKSKTISPQIKVSNQQIVEAAQKYPDGYDAGECRHFITIVMADVGVTLGGGYKDCYEKAGGYEVSTGEATAGDILQIYDDASPESQRNGYHSAIILGNSGGGRYSVIHSNWAGYHIISRGEFNFVTWAAKFGLTVHIFRLGTVNNQQPTNIVGLFPGNRTDPTTTPLFQTAYQSYMGTPVDNGGGTAYVHNWNGRWIQDFRASNGHIWHLVYNNEQGAVWPIHGGLAEYWFNHYGELGSVAPTGEEIPSVYGGQTTSFINWGEACVVLKLGTGQADNRRRTIVWTERNGANHYPVGMFYVNEPAGAVVYEWINWQEYRWPSGHDVAPTGNLVFAVGCYTFRLHDSFGTVFPPVSVTVMEGNDQPVKVAGGNDGNSGGSGGGSGSGGDSGSGITPPPTPPTPPSPPPVTPTEPQNSSGTAQLQNGQLNLSGTMFGPSKYSRLFLAGPNSYDPKSLNSGDSYTLAAGIDRFNFAFSDRGSDWFYVGSDGKGRGNCTFQGFQFHDGWFWINEPTATQPSPTPPVPQPPAPTPTPTPTPTPPTNLPNLAYLQNENLVLSGSMFGPGKFCLLVMAGGNNPLVWSDIPADGGQFTIPSGYDNFSVLLSRAGSDWYWPGRNGYTLAGFRFHNDRFWLNEPLAKKSTDELIETIVPQAFRLNQNFPNPFNNSTVISFVLPEAATVSLVVFNQLGQTVAKLAAGEFSAGEHRLTFTAENLPSGVYLYLLQTPQFVEKKKMLLVK